MWAIAAQRAIVLLLRVYDAGPGLVNYRGGRNGRSSRDMELILEVHGLTVLDERQASFRKRWCVSQRRRNLELRILLMTVPE